MKNIVNYVKNGKGIGLLFLLAAATIITLMFMMVFRSFYSSFSPELIKAADEFLPITVKNGQIVNPVDTYKEAVVNLMVDDAAGNEKISMSVKNEKSGLYDDKPERVDVKVYDNTADMALFPIILDTRAENVAVPQGKQGVYIFKKAAYIAAPNRIHVFSYQDGVLDKTKFIEFLNTGYQTVSITIMFVMLVVIFVVFLLKTCLIVLLGLPVAALMEKKETFSFRVLMRLSAMSVAILESGRWLNVLYLNFFINGRYVFWVALIFEIAVICFYKKSEIE